MPTLVALDLPGGPEFVDALQRVWDGGDTAFPVDQRLPDATRRELCARLGVGAVVDVHGRSTLTDGVPTEPGDALVVATSGSTGEPKGVVLTHAAVAASATSSTRRIGATADDHWLACLPLNHVGGLSVVTRALHTGSRLTVHPAFDAEAVTQVGATRISLVATALRRIDTSPFRTVLLGGSRPPEGLAPNVVTTYGMTETGSGVVYDGRPLDGVEVRAVGARIQLRCPMLLRCYRDGRVPLTSEGWYDTGDLGAVEPDGRLRVDGRADDLIITGGENVWPEQVERALSGVAAIADLAITGSPDPEWGSVVTAHVVWAPDAPPLPLEALRDEVARTLPAYCAPRHLVVHRELPRTAIGKIRRDRLRAPCDGDRDE